MQNIYRARLKVLSSHGACGGWSWRSPVKVEKCKQEIGPDPCSSRWRPEGSGGSALEPFPSDLGWLHSPAVSWRPELERGLENKVRGAFEMLSNVLSL